MEEGLLLALASPRIKKGEKQEPLTAYELMKEHLGIVDSGLLDLASNPRHLEGLGRDSMG